MGQIVQPSTSRLLRGLAILAILAMLGCTPGSAPVPLLFVGYSEAASFPPFNAFRSALVRQHPALASRARFDYVLFPPGDEARERAMRHALESRPRVVIAPTTNSAAAAGRQDGGPAVVFASYLDPVRAGLARSLRTPGGRLTGVALDDRLDGKRLESLLDAFPGVRRVAIVGDVYWSDQDQGADRTLAEARTLGLEARVIRVETVEELDATLGARDAAAFDAWYFPPTGVAAAGEERIHAHLRRLRVPGVFAGLSEVANGGAIGYAQDTSFVWASMAALVARVVDGEDPGTIPIERPRVFKLAVRADATLRGTPISAAVLRRADIVH